MELYLLRSFLAVAEARSFSGAARAIHSTQSAVSRQIAKLEKELGVQLFERYGRHVDCTPAGQLLLPLVAEVVTGTDRVISLAREQAGTATRKVRFGAVPNVLANLLAPILVNFLAESPDTSVDLVAMEDALIEEAVANGELDCAVITPWGSSRVVTRHLLTEEILLVVPEGHHLADCPAVSFEMLAGESILLPPATHNFYNTVAAAMRKAGIEPRAPYRANYPELTKALVRKGVGVAPLPKMLVTGEGLEGLVAIPFAQPLYRNLCLVYQRGRSMSPGTRALMNYVKAAVSHQETE
ncbi:MAG: LysR family transcriptional regulator [Actinobacteria bacterium]|nr:LysR family transcriptional regulator [Actinomycetota bacterium]